MESYDDDRIVQRYAVATFLFGTGGWSTLLPNQNKSAANTSIYDNSELWSDLEMPPYDLHECDLLEAHYLFPDEPFEDLEGDDDFVYYGTEAYIADSSCDSNQTTKQIWFEKKGLKGSVPPELALLTQLETIDLASNDLSAIPSQLGLLSNLQALTLKGNPLLTGEIFTEVGLLSKLELLNLVATGLSGSLPSELGLLSQSLRLLHIDYTPLQGPIPSELGLLAQLEVLTL